MLHKLASYAHFPNPLTTLGVFFVLYAIMVIICDIYYGYFNGVFSFAIHQIIKNKSRNIICLIGLLLCVLYLDVPVTKLCQNLYVTDVYTILDFWCTVGESWVVVGVLMTLSLIYLLLGRSNNAIICKIAYMAAIYAGLCNTVIKFIFNRQRPSIGLVPYNFFYFFRSGDKNWTDLSYAYDSMPSGHTITIFAAIIPLFIYVPKLWQKFLLLGLALLVGFARIYTINHWISDVIAGAILGVMIGIACYNVNLHRIKKA